MNNHPWEVAVSEWCVVSSSGLRVDRFDSQEKAEAFASKDNSSANYIHVVFAPGFRKRHSVCLEGNWYTPEAFDEKRGFIDRQY